MYLAVIFVFFVTLLIVLCFSIASYGNLNGFFCSRTFIFSVCNTIICAILVESGNKSAEDLDGLMTLLGFRVYEEGEDEEEEENEEIADGWIDDDDDDNDDDDADDDDDDDDDSYDGSDGYDSDIELSSDEDDDDSDSDSDNLESRIEEFIAKMSKMWREELMMEKSTN
ncbi:PREDICTED: phosphopantothenoylcysteine decarboxylase subunit VHS3-like [Erythranthe guttata]|uniref:phosphopantothenoylcysteine decarboxylase subunit VHS3-like n=1 Tax=Erythranthe guttata TaxID=4155 RepID=UPI00064DF49F|nr:PREDICTED: phosphopantothenoylcysteine decarboxylase subunit VHS3-like [Erythranthe guttata]|eukprot:XP_012833602.1 PREDICTED: phosphopantothenoylcysteine decarboxylase subunit VHS3-like [Erythranthe guttata]